MPRSRWGTHHLVPLIRDLLGRAVNTGGTDSGTGQGGGTAGESCTHTVTDTPGVDLGTQVSTYPASERDSAHPGLGVPRGQGWCGETQRVTHRYGIRPREVPRWSIDTLSLAGRAGNKKPVEKLERVLGGGRGCRGSPSLGILI